MTCDSCDYTNAPTPASLRVNFPEFSDTTKYTDAQVNFWLLMSRKFLNCQVWTDPDVLGFASQLWTMHYLAISAADQLASAAGGAPGAVKGPATSKTVDKVSAGYASALVALEGGGQWNLTSYGIRFLQIARMVGMGGIQLMPSGSLSDLNDNFNPYVSQ